MSISGVDCYEKDGVAYLKLESVARGLGFTEIAASGNECVRWRTVKNHLANLGIATSCDGDIPEYIPENVFYRLAMKAKKQRRRDFLETLGMAAVMFVGMVATVILLNFLF